MPAPKGNKYAIGNNGGRPPHFDSPEKLIEACENYFEYIKGESHIEQKSIKSDDGDVKIIDVEIWDRHPEPPTVTGLTLFLGFSDRGSLDDYERKEEFSHIIKRARKLVEHGYEKKLHGDKNIGAIFALKNMGWKDKTEVESINTNYNIDTLTTEEKRKRIEELKAKLSDE